MRCLLLLLVLAPFIALTADSPAAEKDSRVYEMRVYYAAPGKLPKHSTPGSRITPSSCSRSTGSATSVTSYPPITRTTSSCTSSRPQASEARDKSSFKEFIADPDWKKAYAESEKDGKLVNKLESTYLTLTDYSPALKIEERERRSGVRVADLYRHQGQPREPQRSV